MALGSTGLVVAAALAAGVAGAGAALVVMESARPEAQAPVVTPAPASPAAAPDRRLAELEERLVAQEVRIRDLAARLEATAHRPGPPGPPPDALADGVPGPEAAGTGTDPAKLEDLDRAQRDREQGDARRSRNAAFEAQVRGRLDRVQDPALTAEQKEAAAKILLDRAERIRAVFEEARASGNADAFREAQPKVAAIRQETRQALEAVLTADQLKIVDPAERDGRGRLGGRPAEGVGRRPGGPRGGAAGGEAPAGGGEPPR